MHGQQCLAIKDNSFTSRWWPDHTTRAQGVVKFFTWVRSGSLRNLNLATFNVSATESETELRKLQKELEDIQLYVAGLSEVRTDEACILLLPDFCSTR